MTELNVIHVRPGIFEISTPDFVATIDAECYEPDVRVRYAAGVGQRNGCNPVYSRDHDFRGTGMTVTVVNANPSFVSVRGERAAVDTLFRVADWYRDRQVCSCKRVAV
jgi:hypothetical protein